jgi:hypothetical protein
LRTTHAGLVLEQILGESLIRILIEAARPRREAALIAAGWEGDHVSAYRNGEHLVSVWISAWKDDGTAQAFAAAYRSALERMHRLRLRSAGREHGSIRADLEGGDRSMLLQVKGSLVLFIDGVATARADETVERIWSDLETSKESLTVPFDSAAATVQLSR